MFRSTSAMTCSETVIRIFSSSARSRSARAALWVEKIPAIKVLLSKKITFLDIVFLVIPLAFIIHQIRNSLRYVSWKDRKAFVKDLKQVYKAANREAAEARLVELGEKWGDKYAIAVRSWENNWEELATFFDYSAEIRRLIYTTNTIEGYNRQLRKVTKTKASFPSQEAVRKLLYLANVHIIKKWTRPIVSWPFVSRIGFPYEPGCQLSPKDSLRLARPQGSLRFFP